MFIKLREYRRSNKVTGEQLSNLLGLKTKSGYYKKELGRVPFTLEEAKTVADFFQKDINDIFLKMKCQFEKQVCAIQPLLRVP